MLSRGLDSQIKSLRSLGMLAVDILDGRALLAIQSVHRDIRRDLRRTGRTVDLCGWQVSRRFCDLRAPQIIDEVSAIRRAATRLASSRAIKYIMLKESARAKARLDPGKGSSIAKRGRSRPSSLRVRQAPALQLFTYNAGAKIESVSAAEFQDASAGAGSPTRFGSMTDLRRAVEDYVVRTTDLREAKASGLTATPRFREDRENFRRFTVLGQYQREVLLPGIQVSDAEIAAEVDRGVRVPGAPSTGAGLRAAIRNWLMAEKLAEKEVEVAESLSASMHVESAIDEAFHQKLIRKLEEEP